MAVRPDEGSNQHALSMHSVLMAMRPDEGCTRSHSAALCGTLRHSAALCGHQRPSSGHQWPSVAISGQQWPSVVISGHQWPSAAIKWPSVAISGHQWPSVAISGHQWPSAYLALSGSSAPRWAPYAQSNSQQRSWPRMLATRRAVPPAGPIWFTSAPASPDEGVHQRSSVLISGHQCPFGSHPPSPPSVAISGHQCSSELISAHSPHTVPAGSNDGRYSKHACMPSGRWRRSR